jgi:hypothetical protein
LGVGQSFDTDAYGGTLTRSLALHPGVVVTN